MTGPRLSVVMPSYRRPDLLARVVPAYLAQRPDELVVVLDGPQPDSRELLARLGAAPAAATDCGTTAGTPTAAPLPPAGVLRVVELPDNRGPAAARAAGVAAATGDVVLVTDDDILPQPGM
ncbi:MAG TPA: glycosyltransferase, partial [Pilimelia sp.]|nr:glycosyltransferase [Pilimelia sp.]